MRAAGIALFAALALWGCGGSGGGGSAAKPRLVVSAAASMTEALNRCSPGFAGARVRLSFAGSDELAAQIRQGFKPDVFAAANTKLPQALHAERRLSRPLEFATNQLVIAIPVASTLRSLDALGSKRLRLVVGAASVPVGSYTRDVLSRLPASRRTAILANVRSNEPDVKGIVGKLTQGAADAGFVYASDVKATSGRLRAIALPTALRPRVTYAAGVVAGAKQPAAAQRYVRGLAAGGCARALRHAGFGPAPR